MLRINVNSNEIQLYILKSIRYIMIPVLIYKIYNVFSCNNFDSIQYSWLGIFLRLFKLILLCTSLYLWMMSWKIGTKNMKLCFFLNILLNLLPIVKQSDFFLTESSKEQYETPALCYNLHHFNAHVNFIIIVFYLIAMQKLKISRRRHVSILIFSLNIVTYIFNRRMSFKIKSSIQEASGMVGTFVLSFGFILAIVLSVSTADIEEKIFMVIQNNCSKFKRICSFTQEAILIV